MEVSKPVCSFCDLPAAYVLVDDGQETDTYCCGEYFEPKEYDDDASTRWVKIDD